MMLETPFCGSNKRRARWGIKSTYMLTYSLYLVLYNEYLQDMVKYLEPKILNEKVEVLFEFFYFVE